MATNATRKRTTLADLMAAAKVGAIDPSTEVLTAADAADEQAATESAAPVTAAPVTLSATEHECGIPGCRHGAAHNGPHQPDRQVKLQCPNCGAVARMTAGAIRKAGGHPTCADGGLFAVAVRRVYTRKVGQ